jgi:hypothetical protein
MVNSNNHQDLEVLAQRIAQCAAACHKSPLLAILLAFLFLLSHTKFMRFKPLCKKTTKTFHNNSPLVLNTNKEKGLSTINGQPLGQPSTPAPHHATDPPPNLECRAEKESCEEMEE